MGAASCGARQCAGTACGVEGGTVLKKHLVYRKIQRDNQKEKLIVFIKTMKKDNLYECSGGDQEVWDCKNEDPVHGRHRVSATRRVSFDTDSPFKPCDHKR
jgi:hypothetical protein